jgi:4-hydroxybenzoate polyprenyltransferase
MYSYGKLVMFSHTVFSLPFALVGAFAAAGGFPGRETLFWIIIAFTGGRNSANAINRIVDRKIDAENPRTADRHLPSGKISVLEAALLASFFFSLLVAAAFRLNMTCVYLLPVAGVLFLTYSFTKRFTWLCHLFLGATCAAASVGGWVAVTGSISWTVLLLGTANALWVMGFDIIYSTADAEHDRSAGLYSIPAVFGTPLALLGAAAAHMGALFFRVIFGIAADMGGIYFTGTAAVGLLFLYQHRIVRPGWLERVLFASYTVNQIVGIVFLVFSLADFIIRG